MRIYTKLNRQVERALTLIALPLAITAFLSCKMRLQESTAKAEQQKPEFNPRDVETIAKILQRGHFFREEISDAEVRNRLLFLYSDRLIRIDSKVKAHVELASFDVSYGNGVTTLDSHQSSYLQSSIQRTSEILNSSTTLSEVEKNFLTEHLWTYLSIGSIHSRHYKDQLQKLNDSDERAAAFTKEAISEFRRLQIVFRSASKLNVTDTSVEE